MGLFGGSSQSTSSINSSIDFSPIIQFGTDQSSTQDKVNDLTSTTSPKLDDSLGLSASVGVGVGGTGSGGPATTSRIQDEDLQPIETTTSPLISKGLDINPYYLLGGVGALSLVYYFTKRKKGK